MERTFFLSFADPPPFSFLIFLLFPVVVETFTKVERHSPLPQKANLFRFFGPASPPPEAFLSSKSEVIPSLPTTSPLFFSQNFLCDEGISFSPRSERAFSGFFPVVFGRCT